MKEEPTAEWERLYRKRCERLRFFMLDPRTPPEARKALVPPSALLVIQSFYGTEEGVLCYVIKQYLRHKWAPIRVKTFFFWHRTLLRKSPEELDALIERSC